MKLYNKGTHRLSHTLIEAKKAGENEIKKPVLYTLNPGETKEIPDGIAKAWLKIKGVEKYADAETLKKVEAENETLKAELKKAKKSAK